VAGLALLAVFLPTFADMAWRWWTDARYQFGFLVPLVAGYIVWDRRDRLPAIDLKPRWGGLALIAAGLLIRFAGIYLYNDWLAGVALLPCVAGFCVLLGGFELLRVLWPAVVFLVFMVPLPYIIEGALAHRLQQVASMGTNFTLQTLGFMSFREGNNIRLGATVEDTLQVERACSGLSMLLVFLAIAVAIVILRKSTWYEIVLIFASVVPIAVLANVVRLTVTGIIWKAISPGAALDFHDSFLAGGLMIALALGLLFGELWVLGWIVVPRVVRATSSLAAAPAPKLKPAKAPAAVPAAAPQPATAEPEAAQPTAPQPTTPQPAAPPPAAAETKKVPPPAERKILPGLGLAVGGARPDTKKTAPKRG
jgi:exosortase